MKEEELDIWTACGGCGQRVTGDSIHTCSPQLKPLSDEEIKELSELTSDPDPTDFVRAIEERHGIK